MGHDYNTFSFVRIGNMMFCLWAKCLTYLHKSNNGMKNISLDIQNFLYLLWSNMQPVFKR